MQPRLTRSRTDRMIAGVCGGLANYFAIDPVIIRLIFVLVSLTSGIGLLVYPVLWIVMPKGGGPDGQQSLFPSDPAEWRQRVASVGEEAVAFGQGVERDMREAFGNRGQSSGGPPTTYDTPPTGPGYSFDPYTGQPLQPQPLTPPPPRRKSSQWVGVALVGLGVMFAAQYFGISTDLLFPVLMIIGGAVMLLRR
jgi:phage shock protein C